MNVFKRATLSVSRRISKSIILFIVVFILGNVIAGAYSIYHSTQNVEKQIKKQLGSTATVVIDDEQFTQWWNDHPNEEITYKPLGLEALTSIGNLSYVNYYDYQLDLGLSSTSFKQLTSDDGPVFRTQEEEENTSYFNMRGVYYPNIRDVKDGKIEIVSGSVFTDSDVSDARRKIVISEDLAQANGVTVGDKITLKQDFQNWDETTNQQVLLESINYEFEIIGLFKALVYETKEDSDKDISLPIDNEWKLNELLNRIYLPVSTAASIQTEIYESYIRLGMMSSDDFNGSSIEEVVYYSVTPFYVLNSPDDVENFKADAAVFVPQFMKISVSSDTYDSISGPIKSMRNMSLMTLTIAIIASILILSLVTILFLRDRKHELGIYLALGEKRKHIFSQIVLEVLIVAVFGLGLSVFSGNFIASSLSNNLLSQKSDEAIWDGGWINDPFDSGVTEEDVKDAYEVKLSASYIAIFMIVGIGVTTISTLAPMIYITRLEPKKILM